MEEALPKKSNSKFFLCLGGIIGLTVLFVVLVLARGLDSNRFFDGITWMIACLPAGLIVPFYIIFDYIDHSSSSKQKENYFPLGGENHDKACRYGFFLTLVALLATLILYFVFRDSKTVPEWNACLIFLIPNAPGLALYLWYAIRSASKKKEEGTVLFLSLLLAGVVLASGFIVFGLLRGEMTYLITYLAFPLITLILLIYKRED